MRLDGLKEWGASPRAISTAQRRADPAETKESRLVFCIQVVMLLCAILTIYALEGNAFRKLGNRAIAAIAQVKEFQNFTQHGRVIGQEFKRSDKPYWP